MCLIYWIFFYGTCHKDYESAVDLGKSKHTCRLYIRSPCATCRAAREHLSGSVPVPMCSKTTRSSKLPYLESQFNMWQLCFTCYKVLIVALRSSCDTYIATVSNQLSKPDRSFMMGKSGPQQRPKTDKKINLKVDSCISGRFGLLYHG